MAFCNFVTLFRFFDLPVFWPVLLIYFFLLTFLTLKERIKHMVKHRYLPFSYGKKTYRKVGQEDGGDGVGREGPARSAEEDKYAKAGAKGGKAKEII